MPVYPGALNTHLGPDEALQLAEVLAHAAAVVERDRAARLDEAGAR